MKPEELCIATLAELISKAVSNGVTNLSAYIKNKLKKWIQDEDSLESCASVIANLPPQYLQSKELINAYLDGNETINKILEKANHHINITITAANGIAVGGNSNTITQTVNNQISNLAKRDPKHSGFSIMDFNSRDKTLQYLSSFEIMRRDIAIIRSRNQTGFVDSFDFSDHNVDSNQFLMYLLENVPGEDWTEFYKNNYSLALSISVSANIHQIQLQIKDTHQRAFVDKPICLSADPTTLCFRLSELAHEAAWADIGEVCLTIFTEKSYLEGTTGHIAVHDISLKP